MEYEVTKQCCIDWLEGGPYVYSASDLLLSEARHSALLTASDRKFVTDTVINGKGQSGAYFQAAAWRMADRLEAYELFERLKADLVAHMLTR